MILLSGQAVFAEPDGTEGNPYVLEGMVTKLEFFTSKLNSSAVFHIKGSANIRDNDSNRDKFLGMAYKIHVLEDGVIDFTKENFFQNELKHTGVIVLHNGGTLKFSNKIWFGKNGARASVKQGTVSLSQWNKLEQGEMKFALSDDAVVEVINGFVVGAGNTNSDVNAQNHARHAAIFEVPEGASVFIKKGGSLILPRAVPNGSTLNNSKFQPTLNLDGELIVESGGKLLAFENSIINANGAIEVKNQGTFAASGSSIFNVSGNVVLKQGATVELRDNSLLQIASGGDFLVGNGGQMTIEPNVSVSGTVQVDGEVIIKANSLDKLQDANFALQENGKIFSLHKLEMNLTNAESQTEKGKIDNAEYFCWVYKKDSSDANGTGDNNTGNQGNTGQDNNGADPNNSSGQNTGEQNGTSGSNNNSNESGTNNSGSNNDSANSGGNQSGTGQANEDNTNNTSSQSGSVNQNSSKSGNNYSGGASYSSVRPDSVNKSPENNSKSSESASSDKNRDGGSNGSPSTNSEGAIDRHITTLRIDDNAFSIQKGESKTNGVIEVSPAIIENRALLPARMLAESLELQVDYDAKNKTILLTQPNDKEQKVLLILGNEKKPISMNRRNLVQNSAKLQISEEVVSENLFVAIENGRILLPLRQIENIFSKLGLTTQIQWNHQTKEITIIR